MRIIQVFLAFALISIAVCMEKKQRKYYPCRRAYRECDWEFKRFPGTIPTFSVHKKADKSFTPRIISKDPKENIGILNTNHVIPEFIFRRKGPVLITKFGHPRFTPTHFKPFSITNTTGSGVGHETFHGSQKRIVRGKCVRVFFTSYQKIMPGHPMIENINVGREDYKCVVFRLK